MSEADSIDLMLNEVNTKARDFASRYGRQTFDFSAYRRQVYDSKNLSLVSEFISAAVTNNFNVFGRKKDALNKDLSLLADKMIRLKLLTRDQGSKSNNPTTSRICNAFPDLTCLNTHWMITAGAFKLVDVEGNDEHPLYLQATSGSAVCVTDEELNYCIQAQIAMSRRNTKTGFDLATTTTNCNNTCKKAFENTDLVTRLKYRASVEAGIDAGYGVPITKSARREKMIAIRDLYDLDLTEDEIDASIEIF